MDEKIKKAKIAVVDGNDITISDSLAKLRPIHLLYQKIYLNASLEFLENGCLRLEGEEIKYVIELERKKVADLDYEPHPSEVFYTTKKWWRKGGVPYVKAGWVRLKDTEPMMITFSNFRLIEKDKKDD